MALPHRRVAGNNDLGTGLRKPAVANRRPEERLMVSREAMKRLFSSSNHSISPNTCYDSYRFAADVYRDCITS
jgi:hypothetical protein